MTGDCHVRICEGLGVKFPRATRRAPRGCTRDEGRPLGTGLQEQVPNRLKLHGLRALVVSVDGKGTAETVSGEVQGDERKRTTDEVSKTKG